MQEKQIQLIKLSDMTPKMNGRPGVEEKTVNPTPTPEIEENTVDLLSVTSEDYKHDDKISFDEGRLQQWNSSTFGPME